MKKLTSHSKTSLFLMEMIISLLILSLTACICVQIFAKAKSAREQAREWNHIQELTVTAGEFLEGSNGSPEEFLSLYPEGYSEEGSLLYYYDSQWNTSSESDSRYCMELIFSQEPKEKTVSLSFYEKEELLFQKNISFPLFSAREEALTP